MRSLISAAALGAAAFAWSGPAAAATPDAMLDSCRARAASAYRASPSVINVKYEGQRTDGTHAVNGSVEGREPAATFQCSFNRSGAAIVRFTRVGGSAARPAAGTSAGFPAGDRRACIAGIRKASGNPRLVVLRTETSEANNLVMVGVGPKRAPWRCLVKRGIVAEVRSETDEGRL